MMRKICLALSVILVMLSFSACSKIEEHRAREIVEMLIGYMNVRDYDSAVGLFCSDNDEGKTFPAFLNETEKAAGLDFDAGITIDEYVSYESALNSYFGVACGDFEIKATIDDRAVVLKIGVLENEGQIECVSFGVYTEKSAYEFLCHYIES